MSVEFRFDARGVRSSSTKPTNTHRNLNFRGRTQANISGCEISPITVDVDDDLYIESGRKHSHFLPYAGNESQGTYRVLSVGCGGCREMLSMAPLVISSCSATMLGSKATVN